MSECRRTLTHMDPMSHVWRKAFEDAGATDPITRVYDNGVDVTDQPRETWPLIYRPEDWPHGRYRATRESRKPRGH